MSSVYDLYDNSTYKNERLQRTPLRFYIWILIDTLIMVMVTAGVVLLFTFVNVIGEFFKTNFWIKFTILGVGFLVFLIFFFVEKIRSRRVGVYVMFSIVIATLSVVLADILSPVGLKAGLISLACILVVEIPIVVTALLLPRMNEKGLVVFNSVAWTSAIVGVILIIFSVFFEQQIILALAVAFCILFILFLLFTCVNNYDLIAWWMDFIAVEFTTAFIIWLCTISMYGILESTLAKFFKETNNTDI
ncbi:unnamed protein product [Trichobilharzia szidati]|nr:unnamed protein product [Trichobilharzia szidati]